MRVFGAAALLQLGDVKGAHAAWTEALAMDHREALRVRAELRAAR